MQTYFYTAGPPNYKQRKRGREPNANRDSSDHQPAQPVTQDEN